MKIRNWVYKINSERMVAKLQIKGLGLIKSLIHLSGALWDYINLSGQPKHLFYLSIPFLAD